MEKFDIIIIGAGSAGLTVTSGAAQLGLKTLLIEQEKMGGDCLNWGCVPSKSLIHAAKVMHLKRTANRFGLKEADEKVNLKKVMDYVRYVIKQIEPNDSAERFRKLGAKVIMGKASFVDKHTIKVGNKTFRGKKIVIASGSRSFTPPIPGLKDYQDHKTVFNMKTLPKKLLVMGGGPIGMEMAQAFHRLGSNVTVIQRSTILNKEDPDVSKYVKKLLEKEGLTILEKTTAEKVEKKGKQKLVTLNIKGKKKTQTFDDIIVAIGRKPNVEGLNLEAAEIKYNKKGIPTDNKMRTNVKHIYAIGDITGPYLFTHTAGYQGGIAIANAVLHFPKKASYKVIPWVTYLDPEVAHVGATEEQLKNTEYKVIKHPFNKVDRAICEDEKDGFVKLLVSNKGKILGVTIVGPHAGEIISEYILAMQAGVKLSTIAGTIHPYPTLAEANKMAAGKFYSEKLFNPKMRKIVKILNKIF